MEADKVRDQIGKIVSRLRKLEQEAIPPEWSYICSAAERLEIALIGEPIPFRAYVKYTGTDVELAGKRGVVRGRAADLDRGEWSYGVWFEGEAELYHVQGHEVRVEHSVPPYMLHDARLNDAAWHEITEAVKAAKPLIDPVPQPTSVKYVFEENSCVSKEESKVVRSK
jgi:hypothetical protein